MTFENWIKTFQEPLDAPSIGFARKVWQAAQTAERERLNKALDELAPAFAELCKKLQLGDD
jgi:hypothetical protein